MKALISAFYKTDILREFASRLSALSFEIYGSKGTAGFFNEHGISAENIAKLVGGDPILDHLVATISREVAAGILAKRNDEHMKQMEALGLPYLDLVYVDLYPLLEEIRNPKSTPESVIAKTDVGGILLLHGAAKGRRIVIGDPKDIPMVIEWLEKGRPNEAEFLDQLAAKAEFICSGYCLLSATYHGQGEYAGLLGKRVQECKYGENGYQSPAYLYADPLNSDDPLGLDKFQLMSGDELSYNNRCDLDRLLQIITHIAATFDVNYHQVPCIAVGVKHGNACGVGISFQSPFEALTKMVDGDPVALYGGLTIMNFDMTEALANLIALDGKGGKRLFDGIFAPSFDGAAVNALCRKAGKCRMAFNPALATLDRNSLDKAPIFRTVRGGFLKQPNYSFIFDMNADYLEKYGPDIDGLPEESDLLLAKAICDTSNSNTITIVRDGMLIGNGVGQGKRDRAAKFAWSIAAEYDHSTFGAVSASDSFFPFVDGPEALQKAGVKAIVTSSGSIKDKEVIDFCVKHDISLYMIPDKIGRGFYNH